MEAAEEWRSCASGEERVVLNELAEGEFSAASRESDRLKEMTSDEKIGSSANIL